MPVAAVSRSESVADQLGFDESFLGVPAPLPLPVDPTVPVRRLDYTHFTVLLNPDRRLASVTGVNIAGALLLDVPRGDDWHLDARVPESEQTGEQVYARNDLDRGHLVRRRDPVWGEQSVALRANFDTFSYTNAAPQVARFNQGKELWSGLEDYLLGYADTYDTKLSVFTGPVLAAGDPSYRGVKIPRQFYKVAAWASLPPDEGAGELTLACTGYLLDQTPELDDIDLETERSLAAGQPPPLGPYRTYQVPVADIAALTGLELGDYVAADRLTPVPAARGGEPRPTGGSVDQDRWVPLASFESIQL